MSSAVAHELVQKSLVGEALENGPVAVFVADDDGRYLAVNSYACGLLGYTREELLALRVTDIAVNPEASADYGEMQQRGSSTRIATLRHKDGTEIAMHFRAAHTTVGGMPLYIGTCWPVD